MKILLLLFCFVFCIYAVGVYDTIGTTGNTSDAATWNGGILPTSEDTVVQLVTHVMNNSLSVYKWVIPAGGGGDESQSGTNTLTLGGDYLADGTGTIVLPKYMVFNNSARALFRIGATIAGVDVVNAVPNVKFLGSGAVDTLIVNRGTMGLGTVNVGTGVTLVISGPTSVGYHRGKPLIFADSANSSLSCNGKFNFYGETDGDYYYFDKTSTFKGTSDQSWITNGGNMNLPWMNYTGSGVITLQMNNGNLTQTDTITVPGYYMITVTTAGTRKWKNNGYPLTTGNFRFGSQHASGVLNMVFGNAPLSVNNFDSYSWNTGTGTDSLQGSTITVRGTILRFGSNRTVVADSSTFICIGAATVTTVGKQIHDITFNNAGTGTSKIGDSLSCTGDVTLINGRDSLAFKVSCKNFNNSNSDSVFYDTIDIFGNYTKNNIYTKKIGTGKMRFLGAYDHVITMDCCIAPAIVLNSSGKTLTAGSNIQCNRLTDSAGSIKMLAFDFFDTTTMILDTGCQFAKLTIIDTMDIRKTVSIGGGTVGVLIMTSGIVIKNSAGTLLTLTKLITNGTAGALDSIVSGIPGSKSTIDCPKDTHDFVFIRDQIFKKQQYMSQLRGGGNNDSMNYLDFDSVRLTHWWKQDDTVRCKWFKVQSGDSAIFNRPVVVRDSIVYMPGCKLRALGGSRIESTPGFTLTVKLNGFTTTPPVYNRSRIRWR